MQGTKVIDLNEARTNLERYARECQVSRVIVTIDGKPTFEMLSIPADDADFTDCLIEENAAFRQLLQERRRESDRGDFSSLEEIRRRLG